MNTAEQCAELIREAESIAVLTGAGVSTNAGIPDFRGPQGLYVTKKYDADTVFDINHFRKGPKDFFDFARDFIHLEESLKPTFTHTFLAQLENSGKLKGVITQNIDSLHQRAGSQNVFEVHGSFWRSHCLKCKREYSYEHLKELLQEQDVPFCFCNGVIKPDVVFFGESVKYMQEAAELAASVDLFFVLGTSCTVFPAASLPEYASGRIVVINNTPVRLNCYNIALEVIEDTDSFFQRVHSFMESE